MSCNIWYALTGLATGGDALVAYAERMGFGASLPFELPTAVSQVTNGEGSQPGGFIDDVELANASYGQAETFVTPLQMALVASTIANDGELMRPRLVTAMEGQGSRRGPFGPETMARVIGSGDARAIRDAMVDAVEGDLGQQFTTGAKVPGVTTAGKSGTAELGGSGEPHSWFIGFAPAEAPTVAIAVVVEQGGRGGDVASPIAGRLLTRYLTGGVVSQPPPTEPPDREPRPFLERLGPRGDRHGPRDPVRWGRGRVLDRRRGLPRRDGRDRLR